ncbi:MAG: isochorismatase [Chloroflexota bacterium]
MLPLPDFFDPDKLDQVWRVPYEERAKQAQDWAHRYGLLPASVDRTTTWLMLVDVQNTFCLPGFELYVAGRSGAGAVDDNRRLCEFIYRNLDKITQVTATLDTHQAMQVFHAIFLVDKRGEHPTPYSTITAEEVREGKWRFNPALAGHFGVTPEYGQERLLHYTSALEAHGKYALTIWPYHAMLGGIGHALVSSVEEAIFFHSIARLSQPHFEVKGDRPFTEHYSVIGPEVDRGPQGEMLGEHNDKFVSMLKQVDRLVIAGQAKSHCVAWTIADLLEDLRREDPSLANKIYLLEDCTSPVVVPGADFTEAADEAFARFGQAGMHIVRSSDDFLAV